MIWTTEKNHEQEMLWVGGRSPGQHFALALKVAAEQVLPAHLALWRFQFISWDNIDEKVKLIKFCNCHSNIISL